MRRREAASESPSIRAAVAAHPRCDPRGDTPRLGRRVIYAEMMDVPPSWVNVTAATSPRGADDGKQQGDYLLCIEGERSWTVQLPASGELIIGRGTDAALRLTDDLVSRAHAQIL